MLGKCSEGAIFILSLHRMNRLLKCTSTVQGSGEDHLLPRDCSRNLIAGSEINRTLTDFQSLHELTSEDVKLGKLESGLALPSSTLNLEPPCFRFSSS